MVTRLIVISCGCSRPHKESSIHRTKAMSLSSRTAANADKGLVAYRDGLVIVQLAR